MEKIRVIKQELIEKLNENKNNHRKLFLKAIEGYRKLVIQKLEESLADAKSGKEIKTSIYLTEPKDQTKDYDRVIKMLVMSVDDEILLSEHEFNNYVLDNWDWSAQVSATNSSYV